MVDDGGIDDASTEADPVFEAVRRASHHVGTVE